MHCQCTGINFSYLCDRVASYLNHHCKATIESSSTITEQRSQMIVLRMRCPTLFDLKPGLASFLHRGRKTNNECTSIDVDLLRTYGTSLVRKLSITPSLLELIHLPMENHVWYDTSDINSLSPVTVLLLSRDVLMLSLLNQHMSQLARLVPKAGHAELLACQKRLCQVELAVSHRKK
jgi:hypothetical protein